MKVKYGRYASTLMKISRVPFYNGITSPAPPSEVSPEKPPRLHKVSGYHTKDRKGATGTPFPTSSPFPPSFQARLDEGRRQKALSSPHTSSTDYGLLNPSNQRRKLETTIMITNKPMVIDPPFNCRERGWGGRVNSTCFVSPAAEIQPAAHRNPDLQKPRTEFLFC